MKELSKEGAKVLDNKCVELGEMFDISINTKSTFNENIGTTISLCATDDGIKSIVQSDTSRVSIIGTGLLRDLKILDKLTNFAKKHSLNILDMYVSEYRVTLNLKTSITDEVLNKLHYELMKTK